MTRTFAVSLTIPDNEAFTAYETLLRLGVPVARVVRTIIWLFDFDSETAGDLARDVADIEAIANPNKHRLSERESAFPLPGEVWIGARDEVPLTHIAGRVITGVSAIRRRTAWRLVDADGNDLPAADRARAVAVFLLNPAFQEATFA
jgi:hypothetical protein